MRSESAGGLMVKALGRNSRDLGSSPSWHSPFPASKRIALRENYLFNKNNCFFFWTFNVTMINFICNT